MVNPAAVFSRDSCDSWILPSRTQRAARMALIRILPLRLQGPNQEKVHTIIHGGELGRLSYRFHGQAEGTSGSWIERYLLDELALYSELDELAGLRRIRIDGIVVGHQQVSVWRHGQTQRSVQVFLVLVNQLADTAVMRSFRRIVHGIYSVVRGGGHVEQIFFWVVDQTGRASTKVTGSQLCR